VVQTAAEAKIRTLVIIGNGEPTENFGLVSEVIAAAHHHGLTTIMFTTASQMDAKQATFYAQHGASLIVSLDSLVPEMYHYLTGTGNLPRVMANIELLRKIYAQHAGTLNEHQLVRLGVNVTTSTQNISELASIRAFCGLDMQFVVNPPMQRGRLRGGQAWTRMIADNYGLLKTAAEAHSETGGHSSLTTDGVCGYFHRGVSVDVDGAFLSCGYAGETGGLLGNAHDAEPGDLLAINDRVRSGYATLCSRLGHAPSCPVRDGLPELVKILIS
jgi:MoaA/NifB/PqqE/SkfB family radical SAM enzyme